MERKQAIRILNDELSEIERGIDKAFIISNYLSEDFFGRSDEMLSLSCCEHAEIVFDVIIDYIFEVRNRLKALFDEQKKSPTTDQSK